MHIMAESQSEKYSGLHVPDSKEGQFCACLNGQVSE